MISKKKLCIMESQPIELSWVKFMLDVRENSYVKSQNTPILFYFAFFIVYKV